MKQSLVELSHAVNRQLRHWVDGGPRCRWCSGPSGTLAACAGCFADLPWNDPCCPRCARPQTHGAPCARCARRPPVFDAAWVALRLQAPVQHAIHRLKYHASFADARLLGTLLAQRPPVAAAPDVIVPVPLHGARLRVRGYNQALEVARVLGAELGIAVDNRGAARVRATADQIGMTAPQRRRNVRGAFSVDRRLAGRSIALLDDVMTTGATLAELARECLHAGAARVEAWAIARAA